MSNKLVKEIYDSSNSNFLLGALLNNPRLCLDNDMPIDPKDFEPVLLHKIIFASIYNLARKGVKECDEIIIKEFLDNYPSHLSTFQDNDGLNYVSTIKKLSNEHNYEYYYDILRKYSAVRDYYEMGNDISNFWDFESNLEDNHISMSIYTLEDVISFYDKKNSETKMKYTVKSGVETMIVGDGFEELLDRFQDSPMIGAGLASPMLNSLYRGVNRGHLVLRGAPSSFGKTTMAIADLCNMSSLVVWDEEREEFVDNPYYQGKGYLIHTEQKMETEIQPRIISTIAKIPYHTVLNGTFNAIEKERLKMASRWLKESELQLINYPTFTGTGLRTRIENLALNGYQYGVFDYLWASTYAFADLRKMNSSAVREDQLLLHLTDTLKLSAEETNTGIMTMIQLNGKEKELDIVDEGCLFGGRSVKTKLDCGSIYMAPKTKELTLVEDLIVKWNKENNKDRFNGMILPNAISHVFKARYNQYGSNLKIWHLVDNSSGQITDMFATRSDNTPVEIPRLYIERKN